MTHDTVGSSRRRILCTQITTKDSFGFRRILKLHIDSGVPAVFHSERFQTYPLKFADVFCVNKKEKPIYTAKQLSTIERIVGVI